MELPKRYLNAIKMRLIENEVINDGRYENREGAMVLAYEIGDSLELLERDQARYVLEQSYKELYCDLYHNESVGIDTWKKWVIKGMGDHHKELQNTALKTNRKKKIEFER